MRILSAHSGNSPGNTSNHNIHFDKFLGRVLNRTINSLTTDRWRDAVEAWKSLTFTQVRKVCAPTAEYVSWSCRASARIHLCRCIAKHHSKILGNVTCRKYLHFIVTNLYCPRRKTPDTIFAAGRRNGPPGTLPGPLPDIAYCWVCHQSCVCVCHLQLNFVITTYSLSLYRYRHTTCEHPGG